MIGQTPEEEQKEREEDERNAGCFPYGVGCLEEGCASTMLPFVAVFVWLLS